MRMDLFRALLGACAIFVAALGVNLIGSAFAKDIELQTDRIAVASDLIKGDARFLVGYEIRTADRRLGGVSGLEIFQNRLFAATVNGSFASFGLERDADGAITSFVTAEIMEQQGKDGAEIAEGAALAQALARDPVSGLIWTAYQREHLILGRRDLASPAVAEIDQLPKNVLAPEGGVQALAAARDRSVIAIVAKPVRDQVGLSGAIGGWRLAVDQAERFEIDRMDGYAPRGADFGPRGDLYLLETHQTEKGARSLRIRRFSADVMRGLAEGVSLGAGEIVLELGRDAPIGKMEALAVDANSKGEIVLTLAADNGGAIRAPTRILQFALAKPDP